MERCKLLPIFLRKGRDIHKLGFVISSSEDFVTPSIFLLFLFTDSALVLVLKREGPWVPCMASLSIVLIFTHFK